MRLQKRLNRRVKDKEYSKWIVTLSPEDVDKLGWREGAELVSNITNDELVIKRKKRDKKDG